MSLFTTKSISCLVSAAAAIAAMLTLGSCSTQSADIPDVEVETVSPADVNIFGEYQGRIRAHQLFEIHARVEGYIERQMFREGAAITKGQPLFIIDPRIYKANVNKARAQLNSARAQATKAKRDLERIRPLFEKNAASQLDLDNAEATYETATAEVEICEADLSLAEIALAWTTVKAPVSGYITGAGTDIGTFVGPGGKSLLATIVQNDTVHIEFSMPPAEYMKSKSCNLTVGDSIVCAEPTVTITLSDGSLYRHKGKLDFSAPTVDQNDGTFSVGAVMPNPDRLLVNGEPTKVNVAIDRLRDVISVPAKAIVKDGEDSIVFVIGSDQMVSRRTVTPGPAAGDRIVIKSGLNIGETVAVSDVSALYDGMKVKPVELEKTAR